MQPSQWLYDFLKSYERYRSVAYMPTHHDKWTCGYGHTRGVTGATTCDAKLAEEWLHDDVSWAVAAVNEHVTVSLTQAQFDALCSFVFNVGATNFEESTLLRKLNDSDYGGAANEFERWDRQAGEVLEGLERRRIAERDHFIGKTS